MELVKWRISTDRWRSISHEESVAEATKSGRGKERPNEWSSSLLSEMKGWGRFHGGVGRQGGLSISIYIYSLDGSAMVINTTSSPIRAERSCGSCPCLSWATLPPHPLRAGS